VTEGAAAQRGPAAHRRPGRSWSPHGRNSRTGHPIGAFFVCIFVPVQPISKPGHSRALADKNGQVLVCPQQSIGETVRNKENLNGISA
jgi:hypothetical protein